MRELTVEQLEMLAGSVGAVAGVANALLSAEGDHTAARRGRECHAAGRAAVPGMARDRMTEAEARAYLAGCLRHLVKRLEGTP